MTCLPCPWSSLDKNIVKPKINANIFIGPSPWLTLQNRELEGNRHILKFDIKTAPLLLQQKIQLDDDRLMWKDRQQRSRRPTFNVCPSASVTRLGDFFAFWASI